MANRQYDAIVIGAGMSGLGAGIRLAMFDKKVLILEKHTISGGLNSYYTRFKRPFDVGLHAMTNFSEKGNRRSPLGKLLKQLRIPYDTLKLNQQKKSQIMFPGETLTFTNDFEVLMSEINQKFPHEIDNFIKLTNHIKEFNEVALDNEHIMAKDVVRQFIKDETLIEMIFCPLLIYGSAWEDDMDFSQFVIMFKSIYLEGFCRPEGGVRSILNLLVDTYKERGGELEFRHGIKEILQENGIAKGVLTTKGEVIEAPVILSSMGYPETMDSISSKLDNHFTPRVGQMTFTESIFIMDSKPASNNFEDTIVFYNEREKYHYKNPNDLYDPKSAVVCFPNNFEVDDYPEGIARVTFMANFEDWDKLERKVYKEKKQEMALGAYRIVQKLIPGSTPDNIMFQDIFSPTTIKRYTGHFKGTVYGSIDKSKDGTTPYKGLYLCGTDQGFLGIVGSLLSGISMANYHALK